MLPISPNQSIAQRWRGTTWTPGQSSIASQTAKPTRKARVTDGADQAGDQLADRQRRHQIIDDRALDLADQQREAGIGEGVLDHAHHDQARREEIGERDIAPSTDVRPERPRATVKMTRNSMVVTAGAQIVCSWTLKKRRTSFT